MKAFLFYGYALKNAGDMAITIGAIDLLISKGYDVEILSRYDKDHAEFHSSSKYLYSIYDKKINVHPCPFKLNRNSSKIKLLTDYLYNLLVLLGFIKTKYIKDLVSSCDLLCFNGGNFFRCESLTDYLRLLALDFPMRIARKLKKKYVILPQSGSKINNIGKPFLSKIFKGASTIFIREGESYKKLKTLFPEHEFIRTIDLAFHINKKEKEKRPELNKKIGITLRAFTVGDIRDLKDSEKEEIISHILRIVDKIKSINGLDIALIVQTRKDKEFTNRVACILNEKYSQETEIVEEYDPQKLLKIYENIDLLIGMRLHSIILAISAGTPCHGIFFKEWGFKNPGLMEDFNLKYFFVDSDDAIYPDFSKLLELKENFSLHSNEILKKEREKVINKLLN